MSDMMRRQRRIEHSGVLHERLGNGGRTREPILMKFGTQQQIKTSVACVLLSTLSSRPHLRSYEAVPLRTTNFSYPDRSLLPWALGRSARQALPRDRGTLFQLGYGTHH